MNGADYVAVAELSNKAGDVLARVGDRCDKVAPSSLPWLAEQGLIQRANVAVEKPAAAKRRRPEEE